VNGIYFAPKGQVSYNAILVQFCFCPESALYHSDAAPPIANVANLKVSPKRMGFLEMQFWCNFVFALKAHNITAMRQRPSQMSQI